MVEHKDMHSMRGGGELPSRGEGGEVGPGRSRLCSGGLRGGATPGQPSSRCRQSCEVRHQVGP